jgi:hypothetical protein
MRPPPSLLPHPPFLLHRFLGVLLLMLMLVLVLRLRPRLH